MVLTTLKFGYPSGEFVLEMPEFTVDRNEKVAVIGFVFQDFELLDYLDVMDNILHPYRITSALKLDGGVRERAAALAVDMGIGDKLGRLATDLSQGEKRLMSRADSTPLIIGAKGSSLDLVMNTRYFGDEVPELIYMDAARRSRPLRQHAREGTFHTVERGERRWFELKKARLPRCLPWY